MYYIVYVVVVIFRYVMVYERLSFGKLLRLRTFLHNWDATDESSVLLIEKDLLHVFGSHKSLNDLYVHFIINLLYNFVNAVIFLVILLWVSRAAWLVIIEK